MATSMRTRKTTLLLLSAVSGFVAHTQRAAACGALPCAQVFDTMPSSVYTPLNPEIRVHYYGTLETATSDVTCDLDLASIRLLPSSGEAIEITGTLEYRPGSADAWVVAKPPAPLA